LVENYPLSLRTRKNQVQVFSDNYFAGLVLTPFDNEQIWDSNYQQAEGWMSKSFTENAPARLIFDSPELIGDTLNFKVRLISQKRTKQVLEITQDSQVISTVELQPAECKDISGVLLLSKGNILEIKGAESLFAIASFKYDYACTFEPKEGQYFWKELFPKNPNELPNAKSLEYFSDIFPENIPQIRDTLFTKATQMVLWEKPVEITKLSPIRNWQPDTTANFLIVTHENLWKSAQNYASYRSSQAGGAYRCEVVTSRMLYDYFNHGDKSTLAFYRYFSLFQSQKVCNDLATWYCRLSPNGTEEPISLC
jgi:hypothetical protein